MPGPEDQARENIDAALEKAGWKVQDYKKANLSAARGVALRNFTLINGLGFADYLLYIDAKAAGVVEAKKEGFPLVGVEVQAAKYSEGLPPTLPAYIRPLPFLYQSTGVETRFTNGLDPERRSRQTFAFHKPDTLADWLDQAGLTEQPTQEERPSVNRHIEDYRRYEAVSAKCRFSRAKACGPRR
jgi:type I restriction enzyme, R subunit